MLAGWNLCDTAIQIVSIYSSVGYRNIDRPINMKVSNVQLDIVSEVSLYRGIDFPTHIEISIFR